MRKAKVILFVICLIASIGGAYAYKARAWQGFILLSGSGYLPVAVDGSCPATGAGCLTTISGATYQIFSKGFFGGYYSVKAG